MERAILIVVALSVLAGLGGCAGPGYGPTYGYPEYGYAPYSYGFPIYAGGYRPDFGVHHRWEDHHAHGHPANFFRAPEAGHPGGGFGGHPGGGGFGGGGHGGRR